MFCCTGAAGILCSGNLVMSAALDRRCDEWSNLIEMKGKGFRLEGFLFQTSRRRRVLRLVFSESFSEREDLYLR